MSFPANPNVGDTHKAPGNGLVYQYTAKKTWKIVRSNATGTTATGFKYTASYIPPVSPSLGDQWYDENFSVLKSWSFDGYSYQWLIIGDNNPGTDVGDHIADVALPLTWAYGNTNYAFELWSANKNYTWIDIDPISVVSGIAGNDSMVLTTTTGLKSSGRYVLYKSDGSYVTDVVMFSILNQTVVRIVNNLTVNIGAADGYFIARTSITPHSGGAFVKNNDIFVSKMLNVVPANSQGQLIIRRQAEGNGTFNIGYRQSGQANFTQAYLNNTISIDTNYRDEYYNIPVSGNTQFHITYTGNGDIVYYMVFLPQNQTVDANRVITPININPADQGVGVSVTPTLVGSPYTSIYGLAQNGAQFQVATDRLFKNIVLSSSTDFLAAWAAISGQTISYTEALFYSGRKGVAVANGNAIVTTTDGFNTVTPSTPVSGISPDFKDVAYNGINTIIAVGTLGALEYSTDFGKTFTSGNASDGFNGALYGVAAVGSNAVAVGVNEILRSVNNGVIWNKVAADNSYNGTFYDVCCDIYGNMVAVGTNGEIQTSNNYGASFQHRSCANFYQGTFYGVTMDNNGNVLAVGANGMIQRSTDYGASWTIITADNNYTGTFYNVAINGQFVLICGSNGEIQSSKNLGQSFVHRPSANADTRTFTTCLLTSDNYGVVMGASGAAQKGVKIEGASTTYVAPAGSDLLAVNRLYYWQCRYQDSAGFWSQWSTPTIFATATTINSVSQPINLSPAANATNVATQPTLQTSAFAFVGASDTQINSQYQIASDLLFNNIVYDSNSVKDFTQHMISSTTALISGSNYYWRVRHQGQNDGWSIYSNPTIFTAASKSLTPVISTPSANSSVYGDGLVCSIASFASNTPNDALQYTQFQFDTTLAFNNPLIVTTNASLTTTLPNGKLLYNQQYYMRAATKGTLSGMSSWSNVIAFTTRSQVPYGEAVFVVTSRPDQNITASDGSYLNDAGYTYASQQTFDFVMPQDTYDVYWLCVASGGSIIPYAGYAGGSIVNDPKASNDQNKATPTRITMSAAGGGGLVYGHHTGHPGEKLSVTVGSVAYVTTLTGASGIGYNGIKSGANGGSSSFGTEGTALGGGFGTTHGFSSDSYDTSYAAMPAGIGGTFNGGTGGGIGGKGGTGGCFYSLPGGGGAAGYNNGTGGNGASIDTTLSKDSPSTPSFANAIVVPGTPGTNGGGGGGHSSTPVYSDNSPVRAPVQNGSQLYSACFGGGVGIFGQGNNGQPQSDNDGGAGSINLGDLRNFGGGEGARYLGGTVRKTYSSGVVRVIWGINRSFPNNAT